MKSEATKDAMIEPAPCRSILITGGAGFIGVRLTAGLRAQLGPGAAITVFDSFHPQVHDGNPGARARLGEADARVVEGDIRDAAAVHAVVAQAAPEIVYHLASETGTGQSFDCPTRYSDVNVTGTAHLIEAIRAARSDGAPVSRVILASTRAVYGEGACVDAQGHPARAIERARTDLAAGHYAPKDAGGRFLTPIATCAATCPPAPASIYASTKLMQEYLLSQAFWGTDVGVGVLRLQNVYGAGQSLNNPYTGVLSIFTRQIAEGRTLDIFEDGRIVRDFVEVQDAVAALVAIGMTSTMPSGPIDIGAGEATTIHDVARHMLSLMDADPSRTRVTGDHRPGDIRHAVADIEAARRTLGWQPVVGLEQGLKRLITWSLDARP